MAELPDLEQHQQVEEEGAGEEGEEGGAGTGLLPSSPSPGHRFDAEEEEGAEEGGVYTGASWSQPVHGSSEEPSAPAKGPPPPDVPEAPGGLGRPLGSIIAEGQERPPLATGGGPAGAVLAVRRKATGGIVGRGLFDPSIGGASSRAAAGEMGGRAAVEEGESALAVGEGGEALAPEADDKGAPEPFYNLATTQFFNLYFWAWAWVWV